MMTWQTSVSAVWDIIKKTEMIQTAVIVGCSSSSFKPLTPPPYWVPGRVWWWCPPCSPWRSTEEHLSALLLPWWSCIVCEVLVRRCIRNNRLERSSKFSLKEIIVISRVVCLAFRNSLNTIRGNFNLKTSHDEKILKYFCIGSNELKRSCYPHSLSDAWYF